MNLKTAYQARDYARFYDWTYEGIAEDIPFYLHAAREHGSPVLELACGTGRITIPLAREGFEVIGLDLSAEMLRIAGEKLSKEPAEVRAHVRLIEADMSAFALHETVSLAFVPAASLFHLHTDQQRSSCLSCITRHLKPGGGVIVDLIPADRMANQTVGETQEFKRGVSPSTGLLTRELGKKLSIDKEAQRVTVEHTYVEQLPDESEKRYVFVEQYTWATEDQMRGLLAEAGFGKVEVFGDYGRGPLTDASPRMIFVARK
jgi:ubiquinone/menaquinone biosynthesis C-methylase UbiE